MLIVTQTRHQRWARSGSPALARLTARRARLKPMHQCRGTASLSGPPGRRAFPPPANPGAGRTDLYLTPSPSSVPPHLPQGEQAPGRPHSHTLLEPSSRTLLLAFPSPLHAAHYLHSHVEAAAPPAQRPTMPLFTIPSPQIE